MAFELTETNPFATTTFGDLNTAREGFTFDPSYSSTGTSWKAEFEKNMPDLSLNLKTPSFSSSIASSATLPSAGGSNFMDSFGNILMGIKSEGDTALKAGYAMKTAAAAGDLFNAVLTYSSARENAKLKEANTKQSVENQMLALDNQVLYYKNQIADKFNQTMARNAVTMAEKNLRVTAGNLLEKTKDAAYDATKDIEMLESNAELKKIALRSEARQAEVASKLTNKLATANMLGSVAKLGLVVSGGVEAGAYGDLFAEGGSLNETVYGG
ncbi:MAG: hypothetical protein J6S85_19000 [Methanobrevibacter sp.]|nr:hypothetical protein [Methanobrevibacter sp.]